MSKRKRIVLENESGKKCKYSKAKAVSDNCWGIIFSFLDIFDHTRLARTSKWLENVGNKPWSWFKSINIQCVYQLKYLIKNNAKIEIMNLKTTYGIPYMKHFKYLHTLKLGSKFFGEDLRFIKYLTQLKKLDLSNSWIEDKELVYIKGLVNLRELNLNQYENRINLIRDEGLIHLKGLVNLQKLNLSYCKITDNGLAHLTRSVRGPTGLKPLVNLQTLDLSGCRRITDEGLAYLQSLENLRKLNLRECCEITDKGLIHIESLVNLCELNLSYCNNITCEGLTHVIKLQKLNVYCCRNHYDNPNYSGRFGSIKISLRELMLIK